MTPQQRRARLNLAHLAMGILFITWLGFAIPMGDARPAVLDVLLGSIGGVWFGMVVKEQGRKDQTLEAKANSAQTSADSANAKVEQLARDTGHGPEAGEGP